MEYKNEINFKNNISTQKKKVPEELTPFSYKQPLATKQLGNFLQTAIILISNNFNTP